jgi:GMP synthase-like glutamine amidotransferase
MKTICVIQHTEAEYLGLIEDHFEGRNIRFAYKRPFTHGGTLPTSPEGFDGLILLGGGPYGLVSGHLLPSASHELRLTRAFLDAGLPVVGIELGAVILSTAAGGGAAEAPLRFEVTRATASRPGLMGGMLPESLPVAAYLRDKPVLPEGAEVFATAASGEPAIFSIGENCLGFLGHPGAKRGMLEDLIMEFAETPDDCAASLQLLGEAQAELAETLTKLMVGLARHTGLM